MLLRLEQNTPQEYLDKQWDITPLQGLAHCINHSFFYGIYL